MGLDDKLGNKADQASGKVKETVGDATDNESLENEGRTDQSKAKLGWTPSRTSRTPSRSSVRRVVWLSVR